MLSTESNIRAILESNLPEIKDEVIATIVSNIVKVIEGADEKDVTLQEEVDHIDLAIKALERDAKVDYITEHWNDVRHNFVAACEAFEDILKVYGRGIVEDVEDD